MDLDKANYRERLESMVPEDAAESAVFDPDILLDRAVERLSRDKPRTVATDVTGDGGEDYDLSASTVCGGATGWVDDFSAVLRIEYEKQTDRADSEAYMLADEDWAVEEDPTKGDVLVFNTATPTSDETFRLWCTRKWQLTATTNTIPDHYCDAICHLAASFYYRTLQATALNSRDTSLNAGLVNWGGRESGYKDLADHHEGLYRDFFGLRDGERAASRCRRFEGRTGKGDFYLFHRPA